MIDRGHVLAEIQRLARENDGVPPGKQRFESETRIREREWGNYWARWGDALAEAGFQPKEWTQAIPEEQLLEKLAALVRKLGRFPVVRELKLEALRDSSFPSAAPYRRFGGQHRLASRLHHYSIEKGYTDVAAICAALPSPPSEPKPQRSRAPEPVGFVYLMKSGRYYKIGRSNAVGRRERELDIALPESVKLVHSIKTDDPPGIEQYWHQRFTERRKKGEWFELSPEDVGAFRRRTFM